MEGQPAANPFEMIDGVGIVVRDLQTAVAHFEALGFGPFEPCPQFNIANELLKDGSRPPEWERVMHSRGSHIDIALIEPLCANSPHYRHLAACGEGVNHITFYCDDLEATISRVGKLGFKTLGRGQLDDGGGTAFFEDDRAAGVLFAMTEWPPGTLQESPGAESLPSEGIRYSKVQIGLLVRDLEKTKEAYQAMGFPPFLPYKASTVVERRLYGQPADGVETKRAYSPLGRHVELELVQPVSGESLQSMWLEANGEGCNHLAFYVNDLEHEVGRLAMKGFNVISSGRLAEAPTGGFAYFDTDEIGGVQIELLNLGEEH